MPAPGGNMAAPNGGTIYSPYPQVMTPTHIVAPPTPMAPQMSDASYSSRLAQAAMPNPQASATPDMKSLLAAQIAKNNAEQAAVYNSIPGAPTGWDPMQAAAQQFAPQFQMLAQMKQQAQQQTGIAQHDIGGMYDSLANAMRGEQGGIARNYQNAGSAIGSAYNQAIANTDAAYAGSHAELNDVANRLGVASALPSATSEALKEEGRLKTLLAANSANDQATNAMLGSNAVDYQGHSADTANSAGIMAKYDLARQLLGTENELSNKGLDLTGQQYQTANQYRMSMAQMQQARAIEAAKLNVEQQHWQGNNDARMAVALADQAKNDLANREFAWQQGHGNNPYNANISASLNNKNATPYDILGNAANQLYGGNKTAASNAVNAIIDTFNDPNKQQFTNATDFANSVMARNPNSQHAGGDYRQLQQLALDFYNKVAGGADKPFQ